MGDKNRKISEICTGGYLILSLTTRGGEFRDIHIKNDKFRLKVPENEFLQMASCVLLARKSFD